MRSRLLQSSQPAVRALHTRRGALAFEEPACRDWMVTSAIVVPLAELRPVGGVRDRDHKGSWTRYRTRSRPKGVCETATV